MAINQLFLKIFVMKMKKLFISFALILAFGLTKSQDLNTSFSVVDENFKKVELQQVFGNEKIRVVSFWATWCRPCLLELKAYASNYTRWKESYDLEVFIISVDDASQKQKALNLAKDMDWPFVWLYDKNQKATKEFGFETLPQTLVYDSKNQLIYRSEQFLSGDEKKLEESVKEYSNKP